jgi:UDP-2,3-diacylglucosamine hydrolase
MGLIAGQGVLPLLVARGIQSAGGRVCAVGLRDQFDPALPQLCDDFAEAGIVQLGRWIRLLRRFGVSEAIMVGRVAKTRMHDPLRLFRQLPDWKAINLWYRRLRHDRRNAVLLAAVADELARHGIMLIDSTTYIPDHMAGDGVMGRAKPSAAAEADIAFGWPLLLRTVELHIGQSIAVRDRDVIAVEAVEGTDAMIERAGNLCRAKGWTLLKTASEDHDRRADVPTIGVGTVERVAAAGGRCIAVGAGQVILLDRPAVIAAADRLGVSIVGMARS